MEPVGEGSTHGQAMMRYQGDFPPLVRLYLNDIFENLVNFENLDHNDLGLAQRLLNEIENRVKMPPMSEEMRLSQKEVLQFVNTHAQNPLKFLDIIWSYREKEKLQKRSNIVEMLKRSALRLRGRMSLWIRDQTASTADFVRDLREAILSFSEVGPFVTQTLAKFRQHEVCHYDSGGAKFYVEEVVEWWSSLFESIDCFNRLIDETSRVMDTSSISKTPLEAALAHLVSSSIIIMESPNLLNRTLRVKKKKVVYGLQIILPDMQEPANITAHLLSEDGFRRMSQAPLSELPTKEDYGPTNIYNSQQPIKKDSNTGLLRCDFNELGFDNMGRERKRGRAGPVMFTKLVYMFHTELVYGNRKFPARCFSLPVVVATHNDQSVQGAAALFWDDYFPQSGRRDLETRVNVSWNELDEALGNLIYRQTGRRLTELNRRFLRSTFLGKRSEDAGLDDDEKRFKLQDLIHSDRNTNFWDWLWGTIIMMTKECEFLLSLWKNGFVVGYISREEAQEVLEELVRKDQQHYFLLRFSKREGKSVVLQGFIEGPGPPAGQMGVFSVDPYKPEHLNLPETSLQTRIMRRKDCNLIVYEDQSGGWSWLRKQELVVPDIAKMTLPEGYVGRELLEFTERAGSTEIVETCMDVRHLDVTSEFMSL